MRQQRRSSALRRPLGIMVAVTCLVGTACTDDDANGFGGVVTVLDSLARQEQTVSVLTANMEGTNPRAGPWRERWDRLAQWVRTTDTWPDLIILQEVPGAKCWFAGGCEPYDHESLHGLIRGFAKDSPAKATYRISYISTGPPVEGGRLHQGRAVLYNAQRLRNVTPIGDIDVTAPRAFDSERTGLHLRNSYPCRRPVAGWEADCSLLDGAGLHWANPSGAFTRYELVGFPNRTIDVYDVHFPTWDELERPDEPSKSFRIFQDDFIAEVERRFTASERVIPPIAAGDFNASERDIRNEVTPGGNLATFEVVAYTPLDPDDDVIGVLVGERAHYPALYDVRPANTQILPAGSREPDAPTCRPLDITWSDHCAAYVELVPEP